MARTGTGANLVVQDVPLVKKHIMREHPEMQDVVFLLVDDRLHVLLVAGYPPLNRPTMPGFFAVKFRTVGKNQAR
jgi:hypothetical protein